MCVHSAGLCPGLNDVVQGLVRKLEDYGVPEGNVLGIRYGSRNPQIGFKCQVVGYLLTEHGAVQVRLQGLLRSQAQAGGADAEVRGGSPVTGRHHPGHIQVKLPASCNHASVSWPRILLSNW